MTSENFGIVATFYITQFLLKNTEINIENHEQINLLCEKESTFKGEVQRKQLNNN